MFVPCPHCGFLVALIVRPDGAPQRCPRCEGRVQDAAARADDAAAASAVDTPTGEAPVAATPAADEDAVDAEAAEASASGDDSPASFEQNIAAAAVASPAARRAARRAPRPRRQHAGPSFVRSQAATRARGGWRWYAAAAALVLLLGVQLLLAQRNELAADARWRPLVATACAIAFCDLPPWHEPSAFTMLQRGVRPSADRPGALSVDASFRNDARWPQPWPTLQLSLSDVDGQPVGARAFGPSQYRPGHRPDDLLAPGETATLHLDVIEPAPRIVAFTFDFR